MSTTCLSYNTEMELGAWRPFSESTTATTYNIELIQYLKDIVISIQCLCYQYYINMVVVYNYVTFSPFRFV